jgi:hypothetical protein
MDLEGAVDLHAHCAPDTRPRKTTAVELIDAARVAGMRGMLLKNHQVPTTALAATLREIRPEFHTAGGLVLNREVGGFNPLAVECALRMGAAQIWMPTKCAANERPGGLTVFDVNGRIAAPVEEILRLMAESNAILGTAHLSPAEIFALVQSAREAGVRKILVNHPEIRFVNLSLAAQKELAGPDVFFERCYVRPLFALSWDELAYAIREVGVRRSVLATDLGQPDNPHPVDGLREMAVQLRSRGFSPAELRLMMCETPAMLLQRGSE